MANYKLETTREELKLKRERLIREIGARHNEIKQMEDELGVTELLIKAIEKEMIDREW